MVTRVPRASLVKLEHKGRKVNPVRQGHKVTKEPKANLDKLEHKVTRVRRANLVRTG